jgi:UDP-2-acetamido-3-amino-2,3-dideoxy-glucuronate N-acetyltransferase
VDNPNIVPSFSAHETAIIDPGATIGPGTRIWHWSHITSQAKIGANCTLGQNVYVANARIGNNVKIQNNVSVYDSVVLEDDVFCGPSMVFTNVINPRSHVSRRSEYLQTLVKRGATIGANAVIICGHTIGKYAMVGAGAVITKDVPDYALVVGNPGRRIGWICQCGIKLNRSFAHARCPACGLTYEAGHTYCEPTSYLVDARGGNDGECTAVPVDCPPPGGQDRIA